MGHSTEELTQDIDATRQSLSRGIDELNDKVNPSRVVQRQKDAVTNKIQSWRDQVMGTASDATGAVTDRVSSAADSVQGAAHGAGRTAQGNPLAAGLVAFGVGLVVSSLIPATKLETRAGRTSVETMKEQVGPVLQDGADHMKGAAAEAAQDLQSTAVEAVEHVKDEATSAAGTVEDEAQKSAESVKQTAADEGVVPN